MVRMKLAGANSRAKISGAQTLPGTVNYFMGNDPSQWTKGVSIFGRANYQQIYPGIDLVYYGTQRRLEYVVYQTIAGKKEMIAGNYKLSGDRVQFALGKYDHNRSLVIDPVLSYLTYLGGSNADLIGNTTYSPSGNPTQGVAVDQAGNVYVTGYTQSIDFPVQGAIRGVTTTNAPTGFVTKLNSAGSQLIYSTYIGGDVLHGDSTTRPYAMAVDGSGNAYVTGFTSSPYFPVTAGAYQTACGAVINNMSNCPNAQSAFLTKLNPNGGLVYSTFLGHTNEIGVAVAVDTQGRAYVARNMTDSCASNDPGNCFPTTSNACLYLGVRCRGRQPALLEFVRRQRQSVGGQQSPYLWLRRGSGFVWILLFGGNHPKQSTTGDSGRVSD